VAGQPGQTAAPLSASPVVNGELAARLLGEAYRFDFFQLVHLLETWHGRPVGRGGPFRDEPLRLRPLASLGFPPADVAKVEEPDEVERGHGARWRHRVVVQFMGLYGVAAPTPVYLTELISATDVDAEELTDFLDLFNHRILSLFYRAWAKYRYPYRYEAGGEDEVSHHLLSFLGLEDPEVRKRTGLPAARLLRYLGLLALRTRPPVGLQILLSDHFGVAARVEERAFRWVPVPAERRNRVGEANSQLGVDVTVGERVPDRSGKVRLSLGPLHFEEYLGFLPGTPRFREVCALARLWLGQRFDFDVELVVRREEIPEARLGEDSLTRLGWTGWTTSNPGLAADPRIVFTAPPERESATA
jgi:type VI secretion system protein ImpH